MNSDLLEMATRITAAYLTRNSVSTSEIPAVIQTISNTLVKLAQGQPVVEPPAEEAKPAVPIRRSVTPEHIVCLECGQKLRMLKRHLKADHGMTVDEYRTRWKLPADYPTVAPRYAEARSALAKASGLGTRKRQG